MNDLVDYFPLAVDKLRPTVKTKDVFHFTSMITFIFLFPVYYSPDDDSPTFSTGALKKTGLFKTVTEYRHDQLKLITNEGRHISLLVQTHDLIDYVEIDVYRAEALYSDRH